MKQERFTEAPNHADLKPDTGPPARYEEEKDLQSGEIRLPHWNKMCQEPRVSDQKTSRVWATNQMVKLSRKIIQQVVRCSQLEGPSPEALPHMPSAQFKKRTTHLDIPGKVYDLYQHVVKTCPFCNSTKPRPD